MKFQDSRLADSAPIPRQKSSVQLSLLGVEALLVLGTQGLLGGFVIAVSIPLRCFRCGQHSSPKFFSLFCFVLFFSLYVYLPVFNSHWYCLMCIYDVHASVGIYMAGQRTTLGCGFLLLADAGAFLFLLIIIL